jgi:cell division protein FtsB
MGSQRLYRTPKENFLKRFVAKFGVWAAILLILVFSISLVRSVTKILEAKRRIKEEAAKVEKLKAENEEIRKKIEVVQTQEYLEKQMRDKLGLAKEGEMVVILPDEETLRKLVPEEIEEKETLPDPTWKKWLKLFF